MYWEILLAIFFGVNAGIITGLIPGIHVNLVAVILLSLSAAIIPFAGVAPVVLFIIAMAVTHTFIDILLDGSSFIKILYFSNTLQKVEPSLAS